MSELPDRIKGLRAIITEHAVEPFLSEHVSVICNGCGFVRGVVVEPGFSAEQITKMLELEGWRIGGWREEADFCPTCAKA